MSIYRKLKYAWLRAPRLIPPLFKEADKVRPLWGMIARPCWPDRRKILLLTAISNPRSYTVKNLVFYRSKKALSGYRIELVEKPVVWFWAAHFQKYDFQGWIAPASDLTRVDSEFFRMDLEYSWLWSSPCQYCGTPRRWYLLEKDPHYGCDICGVTAHDHRKTQWLESVLRDLDRILPGKKVVPIGPGIFPKMLPNEPFVGRLDVNREYIVKDFFEGDESLVTLWEAKGAYSVKSLKAV